MSTPRSGTEGDVQLRVRRGRVDSVDLFEIKENELDSLERGSIADLHFNLAIFGFSIFLTALFTLGTTEKFKSPQIETAFVVVVFVFGLFSLYCYFMWRNSKNSVKDTCAKIRSRIPPDVAAAQASAIPESQTTANVEEADESEEDDEDDEDDEAEDGDDVRTTPS
ncbi:MAG: hypothetical protein A3E01_15455 [Gammaproteobacteria bacterium RIFCSPHIGHO2_12_FULL_63_22]|nr:MAG: hypothetical protein A3E01_15455 [Gammaproteobacteria bacterium RIFCSPHIGHO2_12_FULL_63_22]